MLIDAKLLHYRPQASEDKNVFGAESWRRRQEASQQGSVGLVESLDGEPGVEESSADWSPRQPATGPAHSGGGATQETLERQQLEDKNWQVSLSVSISS